MFRHEIHHAHHAIAASHAHVLVNTVGAALVNGDEVVRFVKTVADYLGGNQSELAQVLHLPVGHGQ